MEVKELLKGLPPLLRLRMEQSLLQGDTPEQVPQTRTNEVSPLSPAEISTRLEAAWSPQPHLSRWIPDHAAMLFAYLQDHCGEFFTTDDLFHRRGGPREDLEACLDLLVQTGLVAALSEPGPARYGAREPRVRTHGAGPHLFGSPR